MWNVVCRIIETKKSKTRSTKQTNISNHQRENFKQEKRNDGKRAYSLREPKPFPKILELPLNIDGKRVTAMVDTGSVENLPDSMVSRHSISVGQLKERKTVEVANGSSVSIYEHCNLQFEIISNTNIKYKSEFLVLPNPTETLILGMRFLTENDAFINLKEGTLTLDGFEYEICPSSLTNNQYDNAIITKKNMFY
ncbi:hypothetical protein EQH57_0205 [Dictyocoela roeselum]|nr:hypothetical protein EQH57_0205 [Dictyocoela roeselum]